MRKDFTKKEVLAINRAIHPKLKEEAKVQQQEAGKTYGNGKNKVACAESAQAKKRMKKGKPCAESAQGKSRDIVAEYAGISHDTK